MLSPFTCGEGVPDWVYLRALAAAGFDRADPTRAFPAPLGLDLPLDPATGYPNTSACQNHAFFQCAFSRALDDDDPSRRGA